MSKNLKHIYPICSSAIGYRIRFGEQEKKSIGKRPVSIWGNLDKRWFCSYLWKIWNILKWIQPKVDRL